MWQFMYYTINYFNFFLLLFNVIIFVFFSRKISEVSTMLRLLFDKVRLGHFYLLKAVFLVHLMVDYV